MRILRSLAVVIALLAAAPQLVLAQADQSVVLNGDGDGPVVLLDGAEISQQQLAGMSTADIGSIEILTGEQALAAYGKYGEHGAIVVSTDAPAPREVSSVSSAEVPAERAVEGEVKMSFGADLDAYVIIDGEPSDMDALQALKPNVIESIDIVKGADAVATYGDVAKQGAIVVVTK